MDVVVEQRRPLDARGGVDVAQASGGHVLVAPTAGPSPPRQVGVLVVHEEALVEEPDVTQVGGAEEHPGPAPGEHVLGLVVLRHVSLEEPAVAAVAAAHEPGAHVVEHVVAIRAEGHLEPGGRRSHHRSVSARAGIQHHLGAVRSRQPNAHRVLVTPARHAEGGLPVGPSEGLLARRPALGMMEAGREQGVAPAVVAPHLHPAHPHAEPTAVSWRRPVTAAHAQVGEAVGEEDLRAGGPHIVGALERLDERLQVGRLGERVVVDQADVVDGVQIAQAQVVGREPDVAARRDDAHPGADGQPLRRSIDGRVVHHDDLEELLGPVELLEVVDALLHQRAAVEVEDDQADPRHSHRPMLTARRAPVRDVSCRSPP